MKQLLFILFGSLLLVNCESNSSSSNTAPVVVPVQPKEKPLTQGQRDSLRRKYLVGQIEINKQGTSNPEGLVSEFQANEIKATQRFKDKYLLVAGQIESIGIDVLNHPYLTLGPTSGFRKLQCTFAETDKSSLAELSKGQEILVYGECKGLMMNVQLDNCALRETTSSLRAELKALMPAAHKKRRR